MRTFEASNYITTQYINDYLTAIFDEASHDDDDVVIRAGLLQAVKTAGPEKVAAELGFEHVNDLLYPLQVDGELSAAMLMQLLNYFKLKLVVMPLTTN